MKIDIPGKGPIGVFPSGGVFVRIPGWEVIDIDKPWIKWLLRDEFSSALPAGSVNGTAAEPGPGTRTVTDGGGNLSIVSGYWIFAGATASNNPKFNYGNIRARTPGSITTFQYDVTEVGVSKRLRISGNANDAPNEELILYDTPAIAISSSTALFAGGTNIFGTYATIGKLIYVARATGNMWFYNGAGTNLLLYVWGVGSNANLNPQIGAYSAGASTNCKGSFFRIPQALWLPTPLLSTSGAMTWPTTNGLGHAEGVAGGLGSGGSGLTMLDMGTWAADGTYVTNTPVVGVERVSDSGMVSAVDWTPGAGWDIGVTTPGVATKVAGVASTCVNSSGVNAIVGCWYQITADIVVSAGSVTLLPSAATDVPAFPLGTTGARTVTERASSTGKPLMSGNATFAGTVDNLSVKLLPISSLISNIQLATTDVLAEAVIHARGTNGQVGIAQSDRPFAFLANANAASGQNVIVLKGVTNAIPDTDTITIKHPIAGGTTYTIASVSALAGGIQTLTLDSNLAEAVSADDKIGVDWASWNGTLTYFDGAGNIKIDEIKAGVYTNRLNAATTFVADKRMIPRKIEAEYRCFYNEALVGTTALVDAASMVGKYWGLFSTLAANQITSFVVHDTGNVTNAHSTLDKYSRD